MAHPVADLEACIVVHVRNFTSFCYPHAPMEILSRLHLAEFLSDETWIGFSLT